MDLCFLAFFTLEIALKLYGFGAAYLRELFNLVDAAIVLGSLAITVVAIDIGASAAGGGTLLRSLPILRVVKVVRLLRVVLAMTRLQRSRERYRRTKMCGFGAPVDRVFEMITELRGAVRLTLTP